MLRYQVILNGDAEEYRFADLEFAHEFLYAYEESGGSIYDGDRLVFALEDGKVWKFD